MNTRTTTRTLLSAAVAAAMVVSLSSCASTGTNDMSNKMSMSTAGMTTSMAQYVAENQQAGYNWFGGPIYHGQPALAATAALVKAGGGAANFKFSTALVTILGQKTVNAEVAKLENQYGKKRAIGFIHHMTYYVNDALNRATQEGITLPPPADLHGAALAKALVKAGTAPDGTFWAGYFFDHTISHKLHNQVMADVDAKYSTTIDGRTHRILNQAMYDVAQALGMNNVKLSPFH